ncbi:MAG: ABC transporter permease subunit [Chloroflexi bacterium]|nr:ABC transporter permease subunit [Chloroflexota bacterium]
MAKIAQVSPSLPSDRISTVWRTFRRLPIIPIIILGGVVVVGVLANLIAPHDPTDGNLRERNLPPFWGSPRTSVKLVVEVPQSGQRLYQVSLEDARAQDPGINLGDTLEMVSGPGTRAGGSSKFLLGTDELGRDILSRIVFGARISLIVSAVTLVIGGGLGVSLGLLSGWYGGWIDEVIMRLVDIILSLPLILVALVMVSAFGQSLELIIGILAIWIWPRFARQVRGEVLQLKTMDYVSAARIAGASIPRILFIHLLPGTMNTVIVISTLQVGIVILLEATLSFMGAGVPPPEPAWGSMVADGRDHLVDAWWAATMPGFAILFTVMSLNLFGDWLRDTLDPRLRQLG